MEPLSIALTNVFPDAGEHTAAFAIGQINVPEAGRYRVALGSDDGFAFWSDGTLVGQDARSRAYVARENEFELDWAAGPHTLIIRVNQNQGPWSLGVQIDDVSDDWPARLSWQ